MCSLATMYRIDCTLYVPSGILGDVIISSNEIKKWCEGYSPHINQSISLDLYSEDAEVSLICNNHEFKVT